MILDNNTNIFAVVIKQYSKVQEDKESDRENGEEIELEKVPVSKAFDALEILRLFKLQQENTP